MENNENDKAQSAFDNSSRQISKEEKRKKRPDIVFYQPPGSRLTPKEKQALNKSESLVVEQSKKDEDNSDNKSKTTFSNTNASTTTSVVIDQPPKEQQTTSKKIENLDKNDGKSKLQTPVNVVKEKTADKSNKHEESTSSRTNEKPKSTVSNSNSRSNEVERNNKSECQQMKDDRKVEQQVKTATNAPQKDTKTNRNVQESAKQDQNSMKTIEKKVNEVKLNDETRVESQQQTNETRRFETNNKTRYQQSNQPYNNNTYRPKQQQYNNNNRNSANTNNNTRNSSRQISNQIAPQTPPPPPIPDTQNRPQQNQVDSNRAGVLKVNVQNIEQKKQYSSDAQNPIAQLNETNLNPSSSYSASSTNKPKMLFDPNNPSKPILIQQQKQTHIPKQQQQEQAYQYEPQTSSSLTSEPIERSSSSPLNTSNYHHPAYTTNKINEAKAQTVIQLIQPLEQRLKQLLDTCEYGRYKDYFEHVNDLRKQLETLCLQATFSHIEISSNSNIDLNHWKICYHQLIECLRKEYQHHSNQSNNSENIAQSNALRYYLDYYVKDGFEFYDKFIKQLEDNYNFNVGLYLDLNKQQPITTRKHLKFALLCVHRCFICMGDLARYKELFSDNRDYSQARSYYLKAMYIAPKSSRAYNQLAVLALYTRRRLDASYYYIRCLTVSTPLLTARQSLVQLFDEARKRSETISENINRKKQQHSAYQTTSVSHPSSNRVELWLKPLLADSDTSNSMIMSDNDDSDNENEYASLSSNELNKRFMLDYLNTIGKLFTKVGMESYPDVCSRMLHEFEHLMKRDVCPIGRMRLLQITVINLSIVHLTRPNNPNEQGVNSDVVLQRTQLQECAVQLCLDMLAFMVKRLTNLLTSYDNGPMDEMIRDVFPSVKIYSDWMMTNWTLWYPLPDQLHPDLGPNPDLWQILCDFFNIVQNIDRSQAKLYIDEHNNVNNDELKPVILDEDVELAGFMPFNQVTKNNVYTDAILDDIELAKDFKRLTQMCMFADFLCTIKNFVCLKYDICNRQYVPAVTRHKANVDEEEKVKPKTDDDDEAEEDRNAENSKQNESQVSSINDENINSLIEKRELLKSKMNEKLKREKTLQNLIESTVSRRTELEIRPRFLVPDTNCFIDHLVLIDNLLKSKKFIIVVPLLVINELDKLAKSVCNLNDDSVEHAEMVQRNASASINYLNEKFESRERNLKALTSQGSVLETIQFRSEELKSQGTTDDLILECCLHYCHDNARDFMPNSRNDAIHLYREVVLLTEDRNLKLKAHTRNVPVKHIVNFCKWANIPLKSKKK